MTSFTLPAALIVPGFSSCAEAWEGLCAALLIPLSTRWMTMDCAASGLDALPASGLGGASAIWGARSMMMLVACDADGPAGSDDEASGRPDACPNESAGGVIRDALRASVPSAGAADDDRRSGAMPDMDGAEIVGRDGMESVAEAGVVKPPYVFGRPAPADR